MKVETRKEKMDTYVITVATGKEEYIKNLLESIDELRPFYSRIWIPLRPDFRRIKVTKPFEGLNDLIVDITESLTEQQTEEQMRQQTEQQTEEQKKKRTQNQYIISRRKLLFPSYLFIDTASYIDLITAFRTYQSYGFASILGILGNENELKIVTEQEKLWIRMLTADEISKAALIDGRIHFVEGPLVGMDDYVCKVKKRKRLVMLELVFVNRVTQLWLPFELVG